jgi:electron transfer flavoprotein alpha subunit
MSSMQDVLCCWWASAGFDRAAQGLLGAGRRLADQLGGRLQALWLGAGNDAQEAVPWVDTMLRASALPLDAYEPETTLELIVAVAKRRSPRVILLGNDTYSQELTPRIAHRLGGSSQGDATAVEIVDGNVEVSRSVYGGKAHARICLNRSPAVVWTRSRVWPPASVSAERDTLIEEVPLPPPANTAPQWMACERESEAGTKLEEARVIVSGGRGLGGPEPFEQLRALADAMGAELAASRAACDAGWVPPSWQVGQTGKKVAPELYLAVGISGASQHLIGIADAKIIGAINSDPQAPIFKHCQFGLVEDYRKVVGPLRQMLIEHKE